MKTAALVAEQLRVDQPGGIAPQFTRRNGPCARRERTWIARATTSLPEPVSPRISTGTSDGATWSTPLHHRTKAALGADDRLLQIVAPETREQRRAIGLGRSLLRGQRAHPAVVLERGAERIEQRLHDRDVLRFEASWRIRRDHENADRLVLAGQRPGNHVAVEVFGQQTRQSLRERARAAMDDLPRVRPGDQRLEVRRVELRPRRLRHRARTTRGGGDGLDGRARHFDAPHQNEVERKASRQQRCDAREGFLDLDVPATFAPDVEKQRCETLHQGIPIHRICL